MLCPLSLEAGSEAFVLAGKLAWRWGGLLSVMHVVDDAFGSAPADWVGAWARARLSEALNVAAPSMHV